MKEITHCMVCGSQRIHPWYRSGQWVVFRCDECTHGFLNPQLSWEELAPYYAEGYGPYQPAHAADASDERVLDEARRTGRLRHVPFRAGASLLDVGCGGGYFLHLAARLGMIVRGVEPSETGAARARSQGLTVFHGTLEAFAAQEPEAKFDIITSNHVVEHVPDPVATLKVMRGLLAPDGLVVVVVPNAECWACRSLRGRWHSTDLPRHLMQFTRASLRRCAEAAGLNPRNMSTYSLPRATASSMRQWLRRWMWVPGRLSERLGIIDSLAVRLAARLDRRDTGEAIILEAGPGRSNARDGDVTLETRGLTGATVHRHP